MNILSALPSVMGAILIAAGIAQVFIQMSRWRPARPNEASFGFVRWRLQTAYPGITMICVGALLLGVGGFAAGHSN